MSEQKRVIYTKEELAAKVKVPAIVEQDLKRIISDRLERCGLYYRCFSRIKTASSMAHKFALKDYGAENKKLQDLVGVRINLYFDDDVEICQNRDQKPGWESVYGLCLQSLFFGECKAGDNPGKSGTDHVLQQQDAADRNMCGSSGNRSERGKCLIICRRLRMIKRIVSSDNCSMHCQANKNAGIMRDLCALQAGDYEDRRDYVYRRNHI